MGQGKTTSNAQRPTLNAQRPIEKSREQGGWGREQNLGQARRLPIYGMASGSACPTIGYQAQPSDKIGPDLNRFRSREIIEAVVSTDLTN